MSFNSSSEANPYARAYNRQRTLFSPKNRRGSSTNQAAAGAVAAKEKSARQANQTSMPRASGSASSDSEHGLNPYDTLLRDTTQQRRGGLQSPSAYDIRLLPDQFEAEKSNPWQQTAKTNADPDNDDGQTVNKRLVSTESATDLRALPNLFDREQYEPRTASSLTRNDLQGFGTDTIREIRDLPEQFFDKIVPQTVPNPAASNSKLGLTMNKRLLTTESMADLRQLPDVFPGNAPTYLKTDNSYYEDQSTDGSELALPQPPEYGMGSSSQIDICLLPNLFEPRPFIDSLEVCESNVQETANKRLLTVDSQLDLDCLPNPFPDNDSFYEQPPSNSETFDVPRSGYPLERLDSNQCINKYAASSRSMYDLEQLPNYFGNSKTPFELCLRDFSRQSIEDIHRLPDPFLCEEHCDHADGCEHVKTAHEISSRSLYFPERYHQIPGLIDDCSCH